MSISDHPVRPRPQPAGEFIGGGLLGHGLVAVEVVAEAASDLAAAAQRCSPSDVTVSKLAQPHPVADQFGHVIDIHADQLRAASRRARATASSFDTRCPSSTTSSLGKAGRLRESLPSLAELTDPPPKELVCHGYHGFESWILGMSTGL